ncbi:MAG: hypothetical protein F4Z01_09670 [Gammaproteobacteria bacterium]|nr:hypothetical protein [Gammaproteobacteria bacterium]MYF37578.1 hypothetical protein [Gammaproteobacteria bacterium]
MKFRPRLLLAGFAILIFCLTVTSCSFWLITAFPVGAFQHEPIPGAVYVHADDDFVLGSDLIVREHDRQVVIAGRRAIGTFDGDYSLSRITTLNRSSRVTSRSILYKPWYFVRHRDAMYLAALRLIVTPYRDKDYYVLAFRGLDGGAQNYELDIPRGAYGPIIVDTNGDGVDSVVLIHPTSPTQVLIYEITNSSPQVVELPTFMVRSSQSVDLNCDGATELFIEMLPLTEKDDEYELSVIAGENNTLYAARDYWDLVVLDGESPCGRQSVRNFKNPRVIAIEEDSVHFVDWDNAEDAIVVHDQNGNVLERWPLQSARGVGYVSGWHEYNSCADVDLADVSSLKDCEYRRFAVVSQSLVSCGTDIAPCGSILVELFDNGQVLELWRSPASTRISHLRENGDLLLHSGNSLVVQKLFD